MNNVGPVKIYDTTLRDGSQAEEIAFSVEDKIRIAQKLDELGIQLQGRRGGRYRLGDPMEVEVEKIERHSGRIELRPPGGPRSRRGA